MVYRLYIHKCQTYRHASLAVLCKHYVLYKVFNTQLCTTPQHGMLCISILINWHTLVAEA